MLYSEYVIGKKNHKAQFEQDTKLFKEDEIDYVRSMVTNRAHGCGPFSDEIQRLCTPLISKAHNTIEIILKEIL